MEISDLEKSVKDMGNWYHKLIYLVDRNKQFQSTIPSFDDFKKINVNKILSQKLLEIPKQEYPLYVYEILFGAFENKDEVYILQHIDILFDPELKILPTQLFEQISKVYKLIVEWPGTYEDGQLYYSEYGHPEYFESKNVEGRIFIK